MEYGPNGVVRVRLNTWQQSARLAAGLLVLLAITAMFAYAALVTATTSTQRVGAWVVCGLFAVATGLTAWGGYYAVRPHDLVVSSFGFERDSRARPMRVGWDELNSLTIERSYSYLTGQRYNLVLKSKTYRLVIRFAPRDPDAFAARNPKLDVYRARFGAGPGEYGYLLGPARELAVPLDEALRAFGGTVYGGIVDRGELRAAFARRGR